MVKLLPAKIWWTLQHSANTFFFDARCDGQAVFFAALILHPRRQEFLTSRFLREFPHRVSQKWWSSCCLQKSDGHCSIPPTLVFLMPGVMVKRYLAALMQHATQGGRNFLHPVSAGISTPCFSEVMVKLLPAKIWWTLQHSANTFFLMPGVMVKLFLLRL